MRHWLPGIDDLLLELVEEAVVLLRLFFVFGHFIPILIFVLHLNEIIMNRCMANEMQPNKRTEEVAKWITIA